MKRKIVSLILMLSIVFGVIAVGSLSAGAEAGAVVILSGSVDKSNTFYEFQVIFGDGGYAIESYGVRCDGVEATFELNKHEGSNWVLDGKLNVSSLSIGDHTLTAYINLYNRIDTSDPVEAIKWRDAGYNVQWVTENGPWFVEVRDGCTRTVNLNIFCTHSNSHTVQTAHTDASCTTDGSTSYRCDCCYKEWTDKIPMLGHLFTVNQGVTAATCVARGYTTYRCERCSATEQRDWTDINSNNHASLTATVTSPGCTTDGYTDYRCTSCGVAWRGDTTGQLNHDFSVYQYTFTANCVSQGYNLYKCSRCNETEKRDWTEKNFSNHASVQTGTTVSPTCTAGGYTNYSCSSCNATWTGNPTSATGHSYDGGVVTTDPTCTADGVKTFTCSKCNNKTYETVQKLGHSYRETVVNPTCTTKGYTRHECVRCASVYFDNSVSATGHTPAENYTVLVPASCFGVGAEVKYCTKCGGVVEAREITKLEHIPEVIPAVPATVTSTGLTEGSKCSVCETVLIEQEVIPKLKPAEETAENPQDQGTAEQPETQKKFTFDFENMIRWIIENIILKIFPFIK